LSEARLKRLNALLKWIEDNPGTPLQKLIDKFALEMGLRKKTIVEYVKLFEDAERIHISDNKIYYRENSQFIKEL